jgi:enoyl-CoA hydratase
MSATVDIQGDVALIKMDDGKANAINFDMINALHAAMDEAQAKAKAIVLTGRDGRFSGGFDLKVLTASGPETSLKLLDEGAKLLIRLYGNPLPVVAACSGHAIAMGVFILHGCDTRIGASGDYKIGANETITGMTLPIFALELSRERLNPTHLTKAIVQACIYDPEGAVQAGYLDALMPLENVVPHAMEVAGQLAALPGHAYSANKLALRGASLARLKASVGAHFG